MSEASVSEAWCGQGGGDVGLMKGLPEVLFHCSACEEAFGLAQVWVRWREREHEMGFYFSVLGRDGQL